MGSNSSSETPEESAKRSQEMARTKVFDQQLTKEREENKEISKLLLLGTGESGKSTLFKQMIKLYGVGFSDKERKTIYVKVVHSNIIANIRALCANSAVHADPPVSSDLKESMRIIEELKADSELTSKLAEVIAGLWQDKGIQSTYAKRNLYQLNDSCQYLLDQVIDVTQENYIPSDLDILSVRVRTSGVIQNEFKIDKNIFQIYDVGGQRSERKKWIHCFENVTAVIFVVALSEYDQHLYEDETVHRVTEALALFDEICNSRWFTKASMIVFFNKSDLFREKLKTKSISVCFPEYKGSDDFDESCNYIIQSFLKLNKQKEQKKDAPKKVFTHVTCARDSSAMRLVFNSVKEILIRSNLAAVGLI
jgi:guanine nucleotide-binding protein subunit alpha